MDTITANPIMEHDLFREKFADAKKRQHISAAQLPILENFAVQPATIARLLLIIAILGTSPSVVKHRLSNANVVEARASGFSNSICRRESEGASSLWLDVGDAKDIVSFTPARKFGPVVHTTGPFPGEGKKTNNASRGHSKLSFNLVHVKGLTP